MAISYTKQAQRQLAPSYNKQVSAVQSQIPAIQNMYQMLTQGLAGQQATGNQNILEGASARGVLNSTIPVYDQAVFGQNILQQQGELANKQQQEIFGINQQVAGIRTDQANAVAQLANQLWQRSNQQQELNLKKKLGNQQYQLNLQRARL